MTRRWSRRSAILGVAAILSAAPPSWAQTLPQTYQILDRPAAAIPVSGNLTIITNLVVNSALPDGTAIAITVFASAGDASFSGQNSIGGTATVAGGKASLRLALPYNWLVASTADPILISENITGSALDPKTFMQFFDNTSLSATIALPKSGAATVTFNSAL